MKSLYESILTSTKSGISSFGTPEQIACIDYIVDCVNRMIKEKRLKYISSILYGGNTISTYNYGAEGSRKNIMPIVDLFFNDKTIKSKFRFKAIVHKQGSGERDLFVYLTQETCLHVKLYRPVPLNTSRDFVVKISTEKSDEICMVNYFNEKMQHLGK